jgi:hypothetical protein
MSDPDVLWWLLPPRACTSRGLRLRNRRLWSEDLYQSLVGALLIGIASAYADGADHLVVDNDR